MAEPISILQQYWGYDTFRPLQEDIIRSVLGGQDTLALLPTGGKIGCLPVVDDAGRLVGIVTAADFLRWATARLRGDPGTGAEHAA